MRRDKQFSETWDAEWKKKYVPPVCLKELRERLKAENKRIATLNGSFDLMHAGHLHIIFEASRAADVLIVLLNSDSSIQGYKGKDRPIIPLERRLQMMAAISFVDYVSYFDELDPRAVLEVVQPDVHVNGAEYGENCIEAETVRKYNGTLHLVDKIGGLSTSQIIHKINSICASSSQQKA